METPTIAGADRAKPNLGRQLLAFAALVIVLAGVALLVAANGRLWVYLCASVSLLIGVVLGMCAAIVKLA